MNYKNTLEFARKLDKEDPLKLYRKEFHIPLYNNKEVIYMSGNSLGLQPKKVKQYVNQELEDWAVLGVNRHSNAQIPWIPYHEFLSQSFATIVGAKETEVIAMNTLTVNLHLMI